MLFVVFWSFWMMQKTHQQKTTNVSKLCKYFKRLLLGVWVSWICFRRLLLATFGLFSFSKTGVTPRKTNECPWRKSMVGSDVFPIEIVPFLGSKCSFSGGVGMKNMLSHTSWSIVSIYHLPQYKDFPPKIGATSKIETTWGLHPGGDSVLILDPSLKKSDL